ncbi:putative ATP-dependent RNA helicase ddx60 [Perkinsus olseni]|uniref:Putative ATP-dependent RNA helicase ddx60 n=6 Tax=Perkinsus olseni TaxID=32597 RepID=A0A7J6P5P7_PEROL|nr:putative ATP-dependent RNA helicase ddx60 [Perkinsus olseni]
MSDFDAASYGGGDDDFYDDFDGAAEGTETAAESGEERELGLEQEARGRTAWGFTLKDETTAADALRDWVSYLPAGKLDLASDIGDSRGIYVVHMESLLINVLQTEMPNFDTQPIFARALFSIERCLSILAELRGTTGMRLVFFDCFEVLYRTKASVFWTLREALRLHLLATKPTLVRVFKDWVSDPAWTAFVEEQGVAFMVCGDNDVPFNPPEDDDGQPMMPSDMVELAPGLLQCLALDIVTKHQIRVAIISTMERRVHRLMSVTIGPERGHPEVLARVTPVVERLLSTLKDDDEEEDEEEEDPQAFVEQIEGAVKDYTQQFGPDGGVRGFITRIGLEQTLQECVSLVEEEGDGEAGPVELCLLFAKVVVACEVLLEQMPLHARSHCTFTDEIFALVSTGDIASALDDFFVNCRLILTPLADYMKTHPEYMTAMGLTNDISDMFDSRLFRTVLYLVLANPQEDGTTYDLSKIFGFQGASLATYEKFWASIVADIDFPDALDVHAKDACKAVLSIKMEVPSADELPPQPAEAPAPVLIQTTVPLVDMIVKTAEDPKVGQALTKLERDETQVLGEELEDYPQSQPFDSVDALLKKHEKGKYTMDSKWLEKLPPHKREAARKKFELRMKQRGMYSTHMYSKSLVGADKLHHPIVMTEEEQNAMRAASDKGTQKLSAKAQQIKEKNEKQALEKQNARDKEQMEPLLMKAERLGDMGDRPPYEIENFLLDLVAGFGRILDSFDGFNGISQSVKLRENQVVVLFAVMDNLRSALKTVGRSLEIDSSDRYLLETRRLVARCMKFTCDVVKSFGGDLTPSHIKKVQQLLQTIGAKRVNKNVFIFWKQHRIPVLEKRISELEAEVAAAAKHDKKSKKKSKESSESKKGKGKKSKKAPETPEERLEAAKEELEDIDEYYSEVRSKKVAVDVIGKDEYLFMLYHMGQDMDRPVGKKADDRVLFKPDEWQRQLLDVVDKKESALVCAPTSSGKTFICYYAMEKVLRQSHDGVAVYVAPTKALLNQVSAEIYSRFSSKTYPSTVRVELAGTFAKEFSEYPMNCQVLVTIPEVFEQVMLAPSQAEWVKKIRYVIFDEVHCIGEAENAAAWEHLMQLTQSPFLALSATVGNPKGFCNWLNSVAASNHGQKVNLVEYKERYNDLKKWVYISGSGLFELHPIACLTYLDVNDGTLPSDLVMTPEEAAECFVALKAVMFDKRKPRSEKDQDIIHSLLDNLEPKIFFKFVRGCISKRQFRWYEKELRAALSTMLKDGVCDADDFNELVAILRNPSARGNPVEENKKWKKVTGEEDVLSTEASSNDEEEEASSSDEKNVDHLAPHLSELGREATYLRPARTVQLIRELEHLHLLPTLIFNFDRHDIMAMVKRCTQYLAKQQYAKYHGSEERDHRTKMENKRRMEVYKKKVEQVKVMEKMKANDEDFDQTVLDEMVPKPIPVEEEYDPEFYFCGVKAMSDPDVEELIKKLERKSSFPKVYIDALRRGIGMHHEGLPASFRKTVEILFRKGFLQVVVATGTLALGINMPCKATVFAGSSVELNALMYRQMAGRAGRRGFDLLGNVIFFDLPFSDIRQLQGSHVPYLRGDFSLTPTLVLRAIQLRQRLKAEGRLTPESDRSIMTMMTKALYSSEMNLANETVILFRYTVDFLLRERLIRPNGDLIGLAPVVTALFEREPDNLVLHRLLAMPGLEDIVKRWRRDERKADETSHATYKLLQVLSWFVLPWPQLRHTRDRVIEKRRRHQPTASCPVLYEKDLEPEFRDLVPSYNEALKDELLRMAVLNFKMKGKVANDEASFQLPFTHTEYRRSFAEDIWSDDSEVMAALIKSRVKCTVRSPFSALDGSGDEFGSAQELIRNCRPGFTMDLGKVPYSPFGDGCLSSYITDFFVHGRLEFLQKDNLLGASESWKIVHEWVETLEWLNTVLESMTRFEAPTLKEVVKDLYTTMDRKLYEEGSK